MAWDSNGTVLNFECESCGAVHACDAAKVRLMIEPPATDFDSDFAVCWRYLKAFGWVSFKRSGKPWTYHCFQCAPDAQTQHAEWLRNDAERERLKARNRRD